jgi:hypothetical protein
MSDMTIDDLNPTDVEATDDPQFCAYCGKDGAAAPHKGEMFHGRCINLVLLHKIPRQRFLVGTREDFRRATGRRGKLSALW